MATEPKGRLHRLPDALPASELVAAEPYLAFLLRLRYPCVQTFLNGPEAAQPQSKGDREAPAERCRALAEGGVVSERERRTDLGDITCNPVWTRPALRDIKRLDPAMARRARNAVIELADTGCDDVATLPRHNTARMAVGWGAAGCSSASTAL